jgi:hypothetical protein
MQTKNYRVKYLGMLLASIFILIAGCSALDTGAELGSNAYSYVRGELIRIYPSAYDKVLAESKTTLTQLKIKLTEEISDGINTTLKAARADGTPVTIKIAMKAVRQTKVGVRCGVLGFWDRKVSQLIHDHIAKRI